MAWDGLGWLGDSVFHDNHEISKHAFFELWQDIMSNPIRSAHDKTSRKFGRSTMPCHGCPRLSAPQVSLMRRTSSIFLATPAIF